METDINARSKLLREKARELQAELELWTIEKEVVRAGEHIVFSMYVEKTPIVVQSDTAQGLCWEMPPEEFFTVERALKCDIPRPLAAAIANRVRNNNWDWEGKGDERRRIIHCETMRAFLDKYPSVVHLTHIPLLGRKCIAGMVRMMQEGGFPAEGSRWDPTLLK